MCMCERRSVDLCAGGKVGGCRCVQMSGWECRAWVDVVNGLPIPCG